MVRIREVRRRWLVALAVLVLAAVFIASWIFHGAAERRKRAAPLIETISFVETKAVGLPPARWTKIRQRAEAAGAAAETEQAIYAAIEDVLSSLDDNRHSFALTAAQWGRTKENVTDAALEQARQSPEHMRLVPLSGTAAQLLVVEVPPHAAPDDESGLALSKRLAKQLRKAASVRPCAVLVDLRRTGGGNMWPAMTALRPLLDGKYYGMIVDREEEPILSFRALAEAQFGKELGDDSLPMGELAKLPLAIAIGPGTVSASEAIAAFLHARPGSVLVGSPSAGLTTTNEMFALSDGGRLMLSTGRLADPKGKGYRGPMKPDIQADAGSDADVMSKTVQWVSNLAGCK